MHVGGALYFSPALGNGLARARSSHEKVKFQEDKSFLMVKMEMAPLTKANYKAKTKVKW
jgi:hypothetical protein